MKQKQIDIQNQFRCCFMVFGREITSILHLSCVFSWMLKDYFYLHSWLDC